MKVIVVKKTHVSQTILTTFANHTLYNGVYFFYCPLHEFVMLLNEWTDWKSLHCIIKQQYVTLTRINADLMSSMMDCRAGESFNLFSHCSLMNSGA